MKQSKTLLTKDDIKELIGAMKEVFLTKDDAKNFLTKDDAKNFLTKDDAKNFLTKDDGTKFATKTDLQSNHEQVIMKLNAIEKRVSSVETDVKSLNEFIVPAIGNILQWSDEIHAEVVREKLLKRVKRVEKHLDLPSVVV